MHLDNLGIEAKKGEELLFKYGAATQRIIAQTEQFLKMGLNQEESLLKSELLDCLEEEMVLMPSDFIVRRSALAYFHTSMIKKHKFVIIKTMSTFYNWSEGQKVNATLDFDKALAKTQFIKQVQKR